MGSANRGQVVLGYVQKQAKPSLHDFSKQPPQAFHSPPTTNTFSICLVEKTPETLEAFIEQWSEDLIYLIVSTIFLPPLGLSYLQSTGDGA